MSNHSSAPISAANVRNTRTSLKVFLSLAFLCMLTQVYLFLAYLKLTGLIDPLVTVTLNTPLLSDQRILVAFIEFFLSHLIIYAVYVACLWYIAFAMQRLFSLTNPLVIAGISLLLWVSTVIWVLTENTVHFPHSLFVINQSILSSPLWLSLFYTASFVLISAGLLTVVNFFNCLYYRILLCGDYLIIIFTLGCLALLLWQQLFRWLPAKASLATGDKPNIIIIGIDGLRPDQINAPYHHHVLMPYLSHLLKTSSCFTETYTPIMQSFPAWMSILTGKLPLHHGARGGLTNYNDINLSDTLPKQLKHLNYETYYAIDSQFFGEILPAVGFDHIIAHTVGTLEWATLLLNDFPLSNLLFLTPFAEWLFPYHYGNRFLSVTYRPQAFFNLLQKGLAYRTGKPLFLAMHLDTSHWPFYLASDVPTHQTLLTQYQISLARTDKQLKAIIALLSRNHLLEHALLILLSDHGISLALPGDRLISEQHYRGQLPIPQLRKLFGVYQYDKAFHPNKQTAGIDSAVLYGHILSFSDQKVLLAMKGYGVPFPKPRVLTARASLIDITPTVRQFLHLPALQSVDGLSLLPLLQQPIQQEAKWQARDFFIENGFQLIDISHPEISIPTVLQSGVEFVAINPANGLLFIKPELKLALIKKKYRSILSGDWLLAYLPRQTKFHLMPQPIVRDQPVTRYFLDREITEQTMVLINLKTREWTTDLASRFASTAPIKTLIQKFNAYNAAEIGQMAIQ